MTIDGLRGGCDSRVAIAGAGIAGLVLALSLRQQGVSSEVFEQSTDFINHGFGLQLSYNSIHILEHLNVLEELKAKAVCLENMAVRTLEEDALLTCYNFKMRKDSDRTPYLVFKRSEFLEVLRQRCEETSSGSMIGMQPYKVTACRDGEHATVYYEQSVKGVYKTKNYDWFVSAEGAHSKTRIELGGAPPTVTGYRVWRTLAKKKDLSPAFEKKTLNLWLGKGCHVVSYPINSSEINVVYVKKVSHNIPYMTETPFAALSDELLWSVCDRVKELFSASNTVKSWPICISKCYYPTHKHSVALCGDSSAAIKPFLAQGASMAIEDAAVLASLIANLPKEKVLKAYAQKRYPRRQAVALQSSLYGLIHHCVFPINVLRNMTLRAFGESAIKYSTHRLYSDKI